ncbi:MAG TPA: DinB family protein [bacterium]|nr:DinB family protein [bacterium]
MAAPTHGDHAARTPGAGPMARGDIVRFRDDTFGTRNWGHKGLRLALRRLSLPEAVWKPGPGLHSVWEQINHVAYWKRYVRERIRGRSRQTNQAWPPAGRTAAGLRRAIAGLERLHRDLRRDVLALPAEAYETRGGPRYSATQLLLGEAAHDAYHIGQIFLTRKLYRRRRRPA